MPEYKVVWEIDIDAIDPREAAEIAREIQLDPDNTATFFEVGLKVAKAPATTVKYMIDLSTPPGKVTRWNHYRVVLRDITWDLEQEDNMVFAASDLEAAKAHLPKEVTKDVLAMTEAQAIDFALDAVSDDFSWCIQGSTPVVTLLEEESR
jgi:hypothetical protein